MYVKLLSQCYLYYKNKHQFSRFKWWRSTWVPLCCAVGRFISRRVGVANNAGSHKPANPALPISADNASSIIKLQAEGQKRIWNNYAMALIRLKDYRIHIKQKIVNSGCKSWTANTFWTVDRFINVKKKNYFGFQHSIWAYFVPFIDIKTYAKNHWDQIMFSDLSTISKFWKSSFLYLFFQ